MAELTIDLIGDRIIPCAAGAIAVPSHPHEVFEWDPPHQPAGEMRFVVDRKVFIFLALFLRFISPRCRWFKFSRVVLVPVHPLLTSIPLSPDPLTLRYDFGNLQGMQLGSNWNQRTSCAVTPPQYHLSPPRGRGRSLSLALKTGVPRSGT